MMLMEMRVSMQTCNLLALFRSCLFQLTPPALPTNRPRAACPFHQHHRAPLIHSGTCSHRERKERTITHTKQLERTEGLYRDYHRYTGDPEIHHITIWRLVMQHVNLARNHSIDHKNAPSLCTQHTVLRFHVPQGFGLLMAWAQMARWHLKHF